MAQAAHNMCLWKVLMPTMIQTVCCEFIQQVMKRQVLTTVICKLGFFFKFMVSQSGADYPNKML